MYMVAPQGSTSCCRQVENDEDVRVGARREEFLSHLSVPGLRVPGPTERSTWEREFFSFAYSLLSLE